ncbi:Phosphatidylinositol kinase (PIK-G2) [Plasmopara halstedii]|uniref:1-phosphatidylinositol 4-kinase n=1 Tax=Plasmopara halstedii TaxID=4781 RepID=A0A0P1AY56_PLAHL|nr:Phosphatidylinositol kinase (PIK-G2) [Plasmopara halstedii]CEG46406.1 Phosphatidylinositol kinase (PIK-G2) [Plasmopara halstedii]|eukprot:XP_024582775.1 Phosphatidylinositol kinase (PIK-G2) [Plasmopara halstedii]
MTEDPNTQSAAEGGESLGSADNVCNMQSAATGSSSTLTRVVDSERCSSTYTISPSISGSASSSMELLGPLGVELDGLGIKGYLSLRDEGVTYHRMKRYYCRCVGINFSRFASRDAASAMIAALYSAEVQKVESWDGKGLWHTYRYSFKLSLTSGIVFNVDADTEEDKCQWIDYIEKALKGTNAAVEKWSARALVDPDIMKLSPGGITFADRKCSPPKFKNDVTCCHYGCLVRFDGTGKRQHHCRNCGGSVCSDHSARFATLRHFHMNHAVRLCMGCHRVQHFTLWLGMLLQRLHIVQHGEVGILEPALTQADEDEVEVLFAIFRDDTFGVSDVIQVLHLHRYGCDEAYAHAVNKLLELSITNLADFEFFLPQIFQIWLTIDWANNNIKAALLFRAICYATQLHIRLATAVYWLTRAAIDDSCGWGFGQSELYIPDCLYRKMCMCKLLMINVEMQIFQGDWSFHPDQDLPATPEQAAIIKCLFDRLIILVRTNSKIPISLGAICDAMSESSIPQTFLASDTSLRDWYRDNTMERQIFTTQIKFIGELCAMTERLRFCSPLERKKALKDELQKLQLLEGAYCPLGSCEIPLQQFIATIREEGTVFTTRARAPTLFFFEVAKLKSASAWLHRSRSRRFSTHRDKLSDSGGVFDVNRFTTAFDSVVAENAIELATSSDIAQVIALDTFSGDEDEQDNINLNDKYDGSNTSVGAELAVSNGMKIIRERISSDPPASLVTLARAVGGIKKYSHRVRSGSLIGSTTKSLDSIIASCADTIKSRRKRSISEGSGISNSESMLNLDPGVTSKEVENFTYDQLISMAQNMELNMSESHPAGRVTFTGKKIVSWMIKNDIVSNKAHALWLGSEMLRCGALEMTPSTSSSFSGFAADDATIYQLKINSISQSEVPRHALQFKMSPTLEQHPRSTVSEAATPESLSLCPSSRLTVKSYETKADIADMADVIDIRLTEASVECALNFSLRAPNKFNDFLSGSSDDRHSVASNFQSSSLLSKFKPDAAIEAMKSIELAMLQHVLSQESVQNCVQLGQDLNFLKDQLNIVYEYVIDKQKRLHFAVESTFGESFEEKKKRLRKTSSYNVGSELKSWDCVAFIVKSNDDLRQEALCQQIIRQLQDIFQSADLPLRLLPYEIIATSASTGLIGYVKNAVSLDSLKKKSNYTTLADHFTKTYGQADSAAYKTVMTNFVRSMAAYSLVCYLLQIKDRHNGNIMIDSDGHVIHIDFGFILGIAPGGRFSLETAPFKLTGEMVDAMGGTQSDYFKAYVIFLIQGFLALQQHADTILMMIAIMSQESSCPCFLTQNPREILSATKQLLRLEYDQSQVIKHVISLVRRSHNSYRTRQYDVFQRMTNGILP